MRTFTAWAFEESAALVTDLNTILTALIEDKKRVASDEAREALTNAQVSLIAARTRAGDMRRHFETAARMGEHAEVSAPVIDHKRAAANDNDDTLTFER